MSLSRLQRWKSLTRTLAKLGLRNLMRVAMYRLLLATRLHPACRLAPVAIQGEFFVSRRYFRKDKASRYWVNSTRYFDCIEVPLAAGKPDWHYRSASGTSAEPFNRPWWETGDFDAQLGDIKDIWDVSRFSWVLACAQRAACGDAKSLVQLNTWLADWVISNPPYIGYNWKCGQEASIRVMHLAMAAIILGQVDNPLPGLCTLVRAHLARIMPTAAYAVAQDNNHGICEAAALFIGGSWLGHHDGADGEAFAWMEKGRRQLEERVAHLIADDGGFSMYSVMYHREFIDALSMAEVWRRTLVLPAFSDYYQGRVSRSAKWLAACVHPRSGDVPNIGANDGTRLLPLTDTGYRDCRPSVQLACVLFCNARAYVMDEEWNVPLRWLDVPLPDAVLPTGKSTLFDQTGLVVLKAEHEDVQVFVRFPKYHFRPSHADPLHLDLWVKGCNILRGPGSYRYHAEREWLDYFPGVAAHNTVQFDGLEAMPRLGRFLFGDWLTTSSAPELKETLDGQFCAVGYCHASGASHHRSVVLHPGALEVRDTLDGFKRFAVLRWHLLPGVWSLSGNQAVLDNFRLTIESNDENAHLRLVESWEARCYGNKTQLPVLEFETSRVGVVTTRIHWND